MAGWMIPEMNWALKLAWYSRSFSWSKRRDGPPRRPNTLTTLWPVNISST